MADRRLYCVMDGEGMRMVDRQPASVRMAVYNGVGSEHSIEMLVEKKNDGTAVVVVRTRDGGKDPVEIARTTLPPTE